MYATQVNLIIPRSTHLSKHLCCTLVYKYIEVFQQFKFGDLYAGPLGFFVWHGLSFSLFYRQVTVSLERLLCFQNETVDKEQSWDRNSIFCSIQLLLFWGEGVNKRTLNLYDCLFVYFFAYSCCVLCIWYWELNIALFAI